MATPCALGEASWASARPRTARRTADKEFMAGRYSNKCNGNTRVEILRSMVEQKPEDAFARYGLAMEYVRSGDLETAVEEFERLLRYNPGYAAGYFHGGQTLEKLGRVE